MAAVRSVLAGFAAAKKADEELVLQIVLGPRIHPRTLSDRVSDPRTSWLGLLLFGDRPASPETRASMKIRAQSHAFKTTIRLGVRAETQGRARQLLTNLYASLKVAEAAGTRLHVAPEAPRALHLAGSPWRWPLILSAPELVSLMGWPLGEGTLPGIGGVHPRLLAPPQSLKNSDRPFANSSAAGETLRLGISPHDSLQHTVLLGPTGCGKSNAMLSLIMADIEAGRGVLVIDPKSDLTTDILARVPEGRRRDVVVIDPADQCPVGLNPLVSKRQNPALVADGILAVFKELYADSWGPRTQDILTGALLTLAQTPNSTLVWLPSLLTDARFRHKLTKHLSDPVGLEPFWSGFEAMSPGQRDQAIAPVLNKLRQFLLRPALRAVLGQTQPLFDLGDLFSKRKIVLVSLNKGLIGSESARLLGSLVVAQLWPLILSRASLPPERRHIVSVFIDEVQDYLTLPTDLADALSQSRGLGVGFTLAHQYRNQLPPSLRAGVDANARNKIVFGLNAGDAHDIAAMAPELEVTDFMLLPRFGVYAQLMNGGHSTGWISGKTTAASPAIASPEHLRAASAATYGRPATEVEAAVIEAIGLKGEREAVDEPVEAVGRRLRRSS
ncbi:MAG: type IV secretory system conjugative DNA transfer family protein [Coriobacteriia bacterium]